MMLVMSWWTFSKYYQINNKEALNTCGRADFDSIFASPKLANPAISPL
jgi:hypothetical protein